MCKLLDVLRLSSFILIPWGDHGTRMKLRVRKDKIIELTIGIIELFQLCRNEGFICSKFSMNLL